MHGFASVRRFRRESEDMECGAVAVGQGSPCRTLARSALSCPGGRDPSLPERVHVAGPVYEPRPSEMQGWGVSGPDRYRSTVFGPSTPPS